MPQDRNNNGIVKGDKVWVTLQIVGITHDPSTNKCILLLGHPFDPEHTVSADPSNVIRATPPQG